MVAYKKKGYLFVIDAFIALSVLTAGFFFIFTFYSIGANTAQQQILARDVINHLSSSTVASYLSSSYNLTNLTNEGDIKNINNLIMEELLLDMKDNYYKSGCDVAMSSYGCVLMDVVMKDFFLSQYNVVVTLEYDGHSRTYYRKNWTSPNEGNSFFIDHQIIYVNNYELVGDTDSRATRVAGPGKISVSVW